MKIYTFDSTLDSNKIDYTKKISKILLNIKAVSLNVESPFTWTSGAKAPIYCDNKLIISFPEERDIVIEGFKEMIRTHNLNFDIIAGTATGAIPFASFLAKELNKPMVYIRHKVKEYGRTKQIEGTMWKGAKVLIIEDLISTGGSAIRSIQACKDEYQADVVAVAAIFTYGMEKAKLAFGEINIPLYTLSNFNTLIETAIAEKYITNTEKNDLFNWIKNPSNWTPIKHYNIGIFGSGIRESDEAFSKALTLGEELGKRGAVVITGACDGMPQAVASKAKEFGSQIIGYSPTHDEEAQNRGSHHDSSLYSELVFTPPDITDVQIARKYRNVMSTANVDVGIIISGRWGTLNEFTNLFDMGKVIGVLTGTGGIADELPRLYEKIKKKSKARIFFGDDPVKLLDEIFNYLNEKNNPKKLSGSNLSYFQRATHCINPTAKKLFELMDRKQTNLALSIDVTKKQNLLRLVDLVGSEICVLKTHIDIIDDFDQHLLIQIQQLAAKHDFVIFEDRKFADIGNTVKHQYRDGSYHIVDWADIVNAHTVPGPGVIEGLKEVGMERGRGLLLLSEMSSEGNLAKDEYTEASIEMAKAHEDFVIGFISTKRMTDDPKFIHMTPGVKMSSGGDGLKQQYSTPQRVIGENESDIIIVGRGIYEAYDPLAEAKRYREAGWRAYAARIKN